MVILLLSTCNNLFAGDIIIWCNGVCLDLGGGFTKKATKVALIRERGLLAKKGVYIFTLIVHPIMIKLI